MFEGRQGYQPLLPAARSLEIVAAREMKCLAERSCMAILDGRSVAPARRREVGAAVHVLLQLAVTLRILKPFHHCRLTLLAASG